MSKATSEVFSSYQRNRTIPSFVNATDHAVFINRTVAMMAQWGASLECDLNFFTKGNKIFLFIWAVIDFLTASISWFYWISNNSHPPYQESRKLSLMSKWREKVASYYFVSRVYTEFYSENSRDIQNTSLRLVKKIHDIYVWCVVTRGQFWPSANSPASVCLSVCPCVCVYQWLACPHNNSSTIQARITKFGSVANVALVLM